MQAPSRSRQEEADAKNAATAVTPSPPTLPPTCNHRTTTALAWYQRSRLTISTLLGGSGGVDGGTSTTGQSDDEFVRTYLSGIASAEFFGGSSTGTCIDGGGIGAVVGGADDTLARHSRLERRRKRWRAERLGRQQQQQQSGRKRSRDAADAAENADTGGNAEMTGTAAASESASSIPDILASIPRGSGLSFVDHALRSANTGNTTSVSAGHNTGHVHTTATPTIKGRKAPSGSPPVVEIFGKSGTGKTRLVMQLAANYVACTGWGYYLNGDGDGIYVDPRRDGVEGRGQTAAGAAAAAAAAKTATEGEEALPRLSQDSFVDGGNDAWASYGLGGTTVTREESAGADSTTDSGSATKKMAAQPHRPRRPMPVVVILDSELGIHAPVLAAMVRAAVLRRWGETAHVRRLLDKRRRSSTKSNDAADEKSSSSSSSSEDEEWRRIQDEIVSALGRIHLIRTTSGTGLSLDGMPVLESLRHSLDKAAEVTVDGNIVDGVDGGAFASPLLPTSSSIVRPPTLLIVDSLTASERIDRHLEQLGSGLSGRNEFFRQLARLRSAHSVAVVGTSTSSAATAVASTAMGGGAGIASGGASAGTGVDPWSKMVTARIGLLKQEDVDSAMRGDHSTFSQKGSDFLAIVQSEALVSRSSSGGIVVPFAMTGSGVRG